VWCGTARCCKRSYCEPGAAPGSALLSRLYLPLHGIREVATFGAGGSEAAEIFAFFPAGQLARSRYVVNGIFPVSIFRIGTSCGQPGPAAPRQRADWIEPNRFVVVRGGFVVLTHIGIGVANKLIRVFDKDGSGNIDFRGYCALHQFLNAMQTAFFGADRDRSGFIDANEMFAAVSGAGFQLSLPTIQALAAKFAIPGRGVDFPNYLFMCAHLAHLRSIFEWNDTDRDGRVTLTYDSLAHIGTDILPS